MNDTNNHEQRIITNARCTASKSRTRVLHRFADSLSDIRLTSEERDSQRAERMYHAARLCMKRGDTQRAQKLLSRSYAICNRLQLAETACNVSRLRIELEHILTNAAAIRHWSTRLNRWEHQLQLLNELEDQRRSQYYADVLLCDESSMQRTFDRYVCKDLHHIIPLYRLCSECSFTTALEILDTHDVQPYSSIYLREEIQWLRLRILFSTQRYHEARLLLQQMNGQPVATQRMRELLVLANAYIGLVHDLYDEITNRMSTTIRLTTFMNSFSILAAESSGMFMGVFVYEIARLLLEHRYEVAHKRLAALRVRMHRSRAVGNLKDLRILLLVIGYILATSHRFKRNFPHHLMAMFYQNAAPTPYAQQGMIVYSELAYRLLKHLGYR